MKKNISRTLAVTILLAVAGISIAGKEKNAQLPGFTGNGFREQHLFLNDIFPEVRIAINAPTQLDTDKKVALVIYALPNGNTIEWTAGKKMEEGDNWHYDIQHVGAQIRFLRSNVPDYHWVVAYVQATGKSWPAWSKARPDDGKRLIRQIVDSIAGFFTGYRPVVMLNGHSGGGRFVLDYIAGCDTIPASVGRIAFIDSNYGYEDSVHCRKLIAWLGRSSDRYLDVLAYKDSLVVYNGQPLVSPTGGTWYRSRKMYRDFSPYMHFTIAQDTCFLRYTALDGRVQFWLKDNPGDKELYHTVLVERNGLIHTLVAGTAYDSDKYEFWNGRAYSEFIY